MGVGLGARENSKAANLNRRVSVVLIVLLSATLAAVAIGQILSATVALLGFICGCSLISMNLLRRRSIKLEYSLERAESNRELADQDLQSVIQHAPIGMAIVAPDGRWIDVNAALVDMLGYSREELLTIDFQTITFPADLAADLDLVNEVLCGQIQSFKIEKRYFHREGRLIWANLTVTLTRDSQGNPKYFISQIQDISDQKVGKVLQEEYKSTLKAHTKYLADISARLEFESRTDELTGLCNRRRFEEVLDRSVASASRYKRPLSILVIDIDHFKTFNDDFGHEVGDLVLQTVAKAIDGARRNVDLVARWGGEEFAVLCPETSLDGASELGERIRSVVTEIKLPYGPITVSVGVASADHEPESLFNRADAAMYRAKANGRNQVQADNHLDTESAA